VHLLSDRWLCWSFGIVRWKLSQRYACFPRNPAARLQQAAMLAGFLLVLTTLGRELEYFDAGEKRQDTAKKRFESAIVNHRLLMFGISLVASPTKQSLAAASTY
jgi:hypothetical protein